MLPRKQSNFDVPHSITARCRLHRNTCPFACVTAITLLAIAVVPSQAELLDTIGVTLLRTVTTNLNGSGVGVAQVESIELLGSPPRFEVNPNHSDILQPVSLFSYHSELGTSTTFTNTVGIQSGHANTVAASFFGLPFGVATNVSHVDNYEANHFINSIIFAGSQPAISAGIVNQSYIFGDITVQDQIEADQEFDNYAAKHGTLLVSGVGNGNTNYYMGAVNVPASCYNGIGVAAYGTFSASGVGPTLDNGRSKPDITTPAVPFLVTSYATPLVTGSAAILVQAALRGDGGGDTTAASDMRTIKALLLNGAVKPADWTNSTTSPLNPRDGAGILNAFNAYSQLAGGQHARIEQTSVSPGGAHPPGSAVGNIPVDAGWDYEVLSSSPGSDRINHYYFNLTNDFEGPFTATATLVWNRQENEPGINDLNFFLYEAATGALIAESVSSVDNVEHLHVEGLPPGRYDLQVLKRGGNGSQRVSTNEDYALAWTFYSARLEMIATSTTVILTWPIAPDGFALERTSSLTPPASWTPVVVIPVVTNGLNRVELPIGVNAAFFRLRQP